MRPHIRSISTLLALATLGPGTAAAQVRSTVPGFNVTYALPSGATLAGKEGRAEIWALQGVQDGIVGFFAGAFSPLSLAFADASQLLEDLPPQQPTVLEAMGERAIGGRKGISATFRVRGADGRQAIVRVAAVTVRGSTTLGAVALFPVSSASAQARVFAAMDSALATASATEPTESANARNALVGTWRTQSGYSSGGSGGGFVDETTWQFDASGQFTRQRNFTASLPGAAVEPTRERAAGRWRVIGDALVIETDGETATLTLELSGRSATIGNDRVTKR